MAASAPTGCFKCGLPGHWSKDCPSSSNPNPNPNPNANFPSSKFSSQQQKPPPASTEKPAPLAAGKKAPRTRPKLTPDLLLSEDGLGYVLRHFPKSFKYHGRGHEVSDLGNLIRLYAQWHSRLLPYYSFDQFIHKVEKVGASRRVGRCLSELRERVARGGDPTKLHEAPVEEVAPTYEQEGAEMAEQNVDMVDAPSVSHAADEMQEEMIDEIYEEATNDIHEASQSIAAEVTNVNRNPEGITNIMEIHDGVAEPNKVQITEEKSSDQVEAGDCTNKPSKMQLTEEQMARMEANRQKALQRAAARASATQAV